MRKENTGIIFVSLAALIWSFGGICIKLIELDPVSLAASRVSLASLFLLPYIKFNKISLNKNTIMLAIGYTWTVSSFVLSTKITTAANAIMLQYTSAIWLFIIQIVTTKKIPAIKYWLPIFSIIMGLIMFLLEPVKETNVIGNLFAISSGVAFAITTYYMAKPQKQTVLGTTGFNNLLAAICLLPFFNYKVGFTQLTIIGWVSLLYQGIFQLGVAYILYHIGLKTVKPLKANIIGLIEPLCNPIWVFLFIGEKPSGFALVGSVFILGGIILETIVTNKPDTLPNC